mmetsp:Transcript_41101/g.118224  ORF Transcript_41101/g.118224 Transcript_41101/m.118224 type:complete len:492 (-) Transcript_41101:36-1511(-)
MVGLPGPPTSFRQRARMSDNATKQSKLHRKAQVAGHTKDALDKFEEHLANLEFKAYEELDEASRNNNNNRSRSEGMFARSRSETLFSRESCDNHNAQAFDGASSTGLNSARSAHNTFAVRDVSKEHAMHVKRPPSPLGLYDYGSISLKPRSVFAQDRARFGDATRPEHRRTASSGYYFPGARFERGPYGFSVLDPVLMPRPRHIGEMASTTCPERWRGDSGDARPLAAHDLSTRRNHVEKPVISSSVRSTAAHTARSKLAFHHLDKRRAEGVLEQARFEHGVYEGKWRDPLLDRHGALPEASPPIDHSWIETPPDEMSTEQVMAMRVLYGVDAAMRNSMGRFSDLFAAENSGPKGVLEIEEFRRGLIRLGSFEENEISPQAVRQAAPIIDPTGNGRIHLPVVARAVAVVRRLPHPPPLELLGARVLKLWCQRKPSPPEIPVPPYGDAAPVDAIRLDHNAGLHNFRKSMEKFRAQQRELLIHHKEICEDADA